MKKPSSLLSKVTLTCAAVAVVLSGCDKSKFPGYKETETGLQYKFYTETKGESKPKQGDIMTLKMLYKNSKDSIIFDSRTRPDGTIMVPLQKPSFKGSLEEAFAMLAPGDSASFIVSADSFFIKTFQMKELPNFIDSGSFLTFDIKMVKFQSSEEVEKEQMQTETSGIEKYLKENNITQAPLESGLIYIENKKGTGAKAEAGKTVSVHYTGKLLNGKVFDSSVERGEPIEFKLGEGMVIPGWDEGIALMNEGGKATLVIPSKLAYGPAGQGPIPPHSPLVFTVELVKVK